MGLRDWLFNSQTPDATSIAFGRFTDLYKPKEKYKSWDDAVVAYNEDLPHQSYLHFIDYIKNREGTNVDIVQNEKDALQFFFYQGSKKICCFSDQQYFNAEVKIASCNKANLTIFRSILEENYRLKYSKYCLDNASNLTLVFQTSHMDANPYKLYYGLKELATIADHKDDALIKSYEEFSSIEIAHVEPIPSYLVKAKFEYFRQELQKLKMQINKLNLSTKDNLGDLVYLIAAFSYKMDCLLLPEGMLMQRLEKLIELSNLQISKPNLQGINLIINELEALERKTIKDFNLEFYKSQYTFGLSNPIDHQHIVSIIKSNMDQLRYYVSQNNHIMANAVCTYVLGKIMYEYAPPVFDRQLIQLYFHITESLYFSMIGNHGFTKKGNIQKSAVIRRLEEIELQGNEAISEFHLNHKRILWDHNTFGPSYLFMMLQSTGQ